MKIKFTLGENAKMPEHANDKDAGYDVFYAGQTPVMIKSLQRKILETNLSWEPIFDKPIQRFVFKVLNMGIYIDVRDRSGMSFKKGLLKMAGVIDDPYRGNIGIVLLNTSYDDVVINPGDKIAQIIFSPCFYPTEFEQVQELSKTTRGAGGYGSTGM